MDTLPIEILLRIKNRLKNLNDIQSLRAVNKTFRQLCNSDDDVKWLQSYNRARFIQHMNRFIVFLVVHRSTWSPSNSRVAFTLHAMSGLEVAVDMERVFQLFRHFRITVSSGGETRCFKIFRQTEDCMLITKHLADVLQGCAQRVVVNMTRIQPFDRELHPIIRDLLPSTGK